jgi:hypothetical protein
VTWRLTVFLSLGVANAAWSQPRSYDEALTVWSAVLERFVDDEGRTDFRALATESTALDEFVEYLGRVSPASAPDQFPTSNAVLAYHINAYNALAMHGVIDTGVKNGFGSFFKRAAFFKFHSISIGGDDTSLYDYETKVIRPLGEPRVHFALNCMVRDCPRLPREPFRAERLEAQLEAAAREFFSKPKHIRVDSEKREVWLSEILDFYPNDFVADGKRQSMIGYANRFRSEPIDPSFSVKFIPYDWTLNQQP